jgi:hypothetical protein
MFGVAGKLIEYFLEKTPNLCVPLLGFPRQVFLRLTSTSEPLANPTPQAAIFLVGGEQLAKITRFVQLLIVVLHSSLHQLAGDTVLHLNHLQHQQMQYLKVRL